MVVRPEQGLRGRLQYPITSTSHEKEIGVATGTGQPKNDHSTSFLKPLRMTVLRSSLSTKAMEVGDDTDGRNRRRLEAQNIRDDADLLGMGLTIIYVGDFNLYDSFELAYQEMVGAGFGQAFDPINRPGKLARTSSFRGHLHAGSIRITTSWTDWRWSR